MRRAALHRTLLAWYRREGRDLPFRRTRDPYRIWIAEVVMQQTRIEAGTAYYERFVQAFPSVHALADASLDQVLKQWEGLGYYARARNLHRAAKVLSDELGGRFPETADALRALPGVGPYTAGAVASIAFGEAVPVVDGNVLRVLSRLLCVRQSIDATPTRQRIWDEAAALVSQKAPGDWNQALMELGARVCLPRSPSCEACPLPRHCAAFASGEAHALPVREKKKPVPHKRVVAGRILRRGKMLLCKRPASGMLGGLWELPGGAIRDGESDAEALRRILAEDTGLMVEAGEGLGEVEHVFSHFRMTLVLYGISSAKGRATARGVDAVAWVVPHAEGLADHPMPTADRRVLARAPAVDGVQLSQPAESGR